MKLFGFLAAVLIMVGATPVAAQPDGQPVSEYRVRGFRSAAFGMTHEEVRAAVERDFGPNPSLIAVQTPEPDTTAFQMALLRLDPGPGPAIVSYLFNAHGRLFHINIGWVTTDDPTADERQAILNAGLRLQRYFRDLRAQPRSAGNGGIVDANTLLLYHAEDAAGGVVEVAVSGVPFRSASTNEEARPHGPAELKLAYAASPRQ